MSVIYTPGAGLPGPIVRFAEVDQIILVQRVDSWYRYRVTGWEAVLPSSPLIFDFGTILAGADDADNSLETPLEVADYEIGQFRAKVLDDIRVTLYIPRQARKFATRRVTSRISLLGRLADPCSHMSEFWFYKDEYPFADANNPGDYDLLTTRVIFWGYRYRVQQLEVYPVGRLEDIPKPYTAVLSEAVIRGGGEG